MKNSKTNLTTTRALNDTNFHRILSAYISGGYVYSQGVYSYLPLNGTLVWAYIESLSPESINYLGDLSRNKQESIGLEYDLNNKSTLLSYMLAYAAYKNNSKIELLEAAGKLIAKGAIFSVKDTQNAAKLEIDLTRIWKKLDGSSASCENITSLTEKLTKVSKIVTYNAEQKAEMLKTLLYDLYYHKDLDAVYAEVLKDELAHPNLNILEIAHSAFESRLKAIDDATKTSPIKDDIISTGIGEKLKAIINNLSIKMTIDLLIKKEREILDKYKIYKGWSDTLGIIEKDPNKPNFIEVNKNLKEAENDLIKLNSKAEGIITGYNLLLEKQNSLEPYNCRKNKELEAVDRSVKIEAYGNPNNLIEFLRECSVSNEHLCRLLKSSIESGNENFIIPLLQLGINLKSRRVDKETNNTMLHYALYASVSENVMIEAAKIAIFHLDPEQLEVKNKQGLRPLEVITSDDTTIGAYSYLEYLKSKALKSNQEVKR